MPRRRPLRWQNNSSTMVVACCFVLCVVSMLRWILFSLLSPSVLNLSENGKDLGSTMFANFVVIILTFGSVSIPLIILID